MTDFEDRAAEVVAKLWANWTTRIEVETAIIAFARAEVERVLGELEEYFFDGDLTPFTRRKVIDEIRRRRAQGEGK